jgi:NAD(P) transhydrogenase subunit beta
VSSAWRDTAYLIAGVCFILTLKGLSAPRTARMGTLIGSCGAALAVIVSLTTPHLKHLGLIIGAIVVGAAIGLPTARQVRMTAMPQLVALFNGVGGGAAALVAAMEFLRTRPVVLPAGRWVTIGVAGASVLFAVLLVPWPSTALMVLLAMLALAFGVLFVLPVGGADVPIVISLLNAFTGLTVAASGYVLDNTLLVIAGTLVGASGTLLTRMMAAAMGRPLTGTLFGAFTATASGAGAGGDGAARPVRTSSPEDVAILLGYARKVVIVPGYGLAVAQAQHTVREVADLLTSRGVQVSYGIHPVAGRMPGHMNVLLAEANVPYESLLELDAANSELASADVAVVIGANDVVNPAARQPTGSPISGMPILDVDLAQQVVFCKRSMRPGFAGVENELLYAQNTSLLFGDAKESMAKVLAALKAQ